MSALPFAIIHNSADQEAIGQTDSMAGLSPFDRGLAYGDGLFETMLSIDGNIPFGPLHCQRMLSGAEVLQIPLNEDSVKEQLNRCLSQCDSSGVLVIKTIVTRGVGGRGYYPVKDQPATLVTSVHAPPHNDYSESGVATTLCRYRLPRNPTLAGIKHLNRLDNVLASMEVDGERFQEGIVFDQQGLLIEALSRNIFLVRDNVLLTPKLDQVGVAGVMRRLVLERYAARLNIDVKEVELTQAELWSAEEVFLTNSISGVWPVRSIDDVAVPAGQVAQRIHHAWQQDCCAGETVSL